MDTKQQIIDKIMFIVKSWGVDDFVFKFVKQILSYIDIYTLQAIALHYSEFKSRHCVVCGKTHLSTTPEGQDCFCSDECFSKIF